MKAGVRAVGVAESFTGEQSTLAGVVTRADGVVDGMAFNTCTVGGTDATDCIIELLGHVLRDDVQYVLVAGIAPAWYNLIDFHQVHQAANRPVCAVTFEASDGLTDSLRREFNGDALQHRLDIYQRLPDRTALTVNEQTLYLRPIGITQDEAEELVRAFTPTGGRPEPLRVARLTARAADRWRRAL